MVESIRELRKICKREETLPFWHDRIYYSFMRVICIYFTKVFLYTKTTPNQVSLLSITIGAIGAYLFSIGSYWYSIIGALLLQLMVLLDNVDGEIARYRKQTSLKGRFLEFIGNIVVEPLIFVSLSFGVYKTILDIRIFLLGSLAASAILFREILVMIGPYLYFEIKVEGSKFEIKTRKKEKAIRGVFIFYIKKIYDNIGFIFSFPAIYNIILISAIFNILPYTFIFYGVTLPFVILISLFYEYNHCFQRIVDRTKKKF